MGHWSLPIRADDANGDRAPYDPKLASDPDVLVYRITGAFFFGAASTIGSVLDGFRIARKAFVIDFAAVPFLDSTAANAIKGIAGKAKRQGVRVILTGTSQGVRRALLTHGARPPLVKYRADVAAAVSEIKTRQVAAIQEASSLRDGMANGYRLREVAIGTLTYGHLHPETVWRFTAAAALMVCDHAVAAQRERI